MTSTADNQTTAPRRVQRARVKGWKRALSRTGRPARRQTSTIRSATPEPINWWTSTWPASVKEVNGYVPSIMCPEGNGYGDYVIMKVDAEGRIANWRPDVQILVEAD